MNIEALPLGPLPLLFTLVWWAGAVDAADTAGTAGTVVGLQVNTTSADAYLQHHGRVFVKDAGGNLTVYHWGGTACGTRLLTEAQVAALQQALGKMRMRIKPLHQAGQGDALCLVGFTLAPPGSVNSVVAIP
jgi:hypothetical protein